MGTNYYIHLGKRSGIGGGKCSFTYAVPLTVLSAFDNVEVIDEYGDTMSMGEFLQKISSDERLDAVNSRFC